MYLIYFKKLNELFSTWITYDIAYKDNGEIDYSISNPKTVNFYNKLSSNNNAAGFVYGANLDAITRNIVSDNITTKLYVNQLIANSHLLVLVLLNLLKIIFRKNYF